MATRLGVTLDELYLQAQKGEPLAISSMCTVFAESEVISHIGKGEKREDIAAGIIDSVASKVENLCIRHGIRGDIYLTGGLCDSPYFVKILSNKLGQEITTNSFARYAGALGAAMVAGKISQVEMLEA
jgi:activator of 2-hydroxyglutaryl-CoA dehydratase